MVLPGHGISWKDFYKALKAEWARDDLFDVAGSLTFFLVLAFFPFLLFLVSLAGMILDPSLAAVLVDELARVAPEAVTQIVGERLNALAQGGSPSLLTLSAAGAIFSASSGVAALMRALNRAYGVKESRPLWKVRGIALLTTMVTAAGSLLAAVVMVATPGLARLLPGPVASAVLWLRLPVAGLLMMLVWALLYYFLPDVEQRFRFITPGSVTGVAIWLIASIGFSTYVEHFGSYEVSYGALGGVIVLLIWLWISSLVVVVGAEVNAILEHVSPEGKKVGARSMEEAGPDLTKSEKLEAEEERRMPTPSAVGAAVPVEAPERALAQRPPRRRAPASVVAAALGVGFLLGRKTFRL